MRASGRPTILVISDDPRQRAALKAELELSGFWDCVFTAGGPEEALREAEAHPPDLVVCHRLLDQDGGVDTCRSLGLDHSVPALVLGTPEEAELVAGDAYLPTPWVFRDFLDVVRRLLPSTNLDLTPGRGPDASWDEIEHGYKDLFDRASDVILLMDFDTHTVIDANRRAGAVYGHSRQELIGVSLL